MRGGLCGKLLTVHGRPSQLLLAHPAVIDPIARYWPRTVTFTYSTCIRRRVRGSLSEYCQNIWRCLQQQTDSLIAITVAKVSTLVIAPLTWVRLVISSALQSRKWQLIGMSQ